jgi:SAM-dependent methyltransferase
MKKKPHLWRDATALYDSMAPEYDAAFTSGYRRAYDLLAGEYITQMLPTAPGVILDAGCGTGRWASRWLALGHEVIGIERSPQMIAEQRLKNLGSRFRLIAEGMVEAQVEPGSVDMVVAMGSVHYTADPAAVMRRFVSWVKLGGYVCCYVDSLVALIIELLRIGQTEEALRRLRSRRGVFRRDDQVAELHLYDANGLMQLFRDAGLAEVECHGLLITASSWGKDRCSEAMAEDEDAFLSLERTLMAQAAMADAGKHIIASGRRL